MEIVDQSVAMSYSLKYSIFGRTFFIRNIARDIIFYCLSGKKLCDEL